MTLGDIWLDGKKYRIDLSSFRGRDIIDFAPRATVPGGSVIMSDLSLYQPLVQTDWQHGFGFHWHSDAQGYLRTYGSIDTRQDGLISLMTKSTSSETNNNVKNGAVNWNNALYAWGAAGLRKYSGGSWSSIYSSGAVNFALAAGTYLFFCPDGARIQKINTSDTVTDAGLDANATDYSWLIIHNGFIYAGKDGTNHIHYSDQEDLSDLEGTTADTNIIYAGIGNKPTLGAVSYAGQLYVSRADGLWHIGEDNICRNILNYSMEESADNFRGMAVINGFLVFPVRNKMIQWNGARVAEFTPEKVTDTFPYVTYGRFDNLVAVDNFLYCTARTNESIYSEHLLCFDGVGWHKLEETISNGTDTVTMLAYDTINSRLWYHIQATADDTRYIPFQTTSPMPYADFPTTGSHGMITSRIDAGFRRVIKSATSLWVEAANVTSQRYIAVYYSLDGDSWVFWDNVVADGLTELVHPGSNPTIEFNYMQLKFEFVTNGATQSPILESYTLRLILRPDTSWGYTFNIVAASEFLSDDREDERTAPELVRDVRDLRSSKAPIEMVDLLGDTMKGYVTSVTEQPTFRVSADEDEEPTVEYWLHLNFVGLESVTDIGDE